VYRERYGDRLAKNKMAKGDAAKKHIREDDYREERLSEIVSLQLGSIAYV
jgi:hypothetical protein